MRMVIYQNCHRGDTVVRQERQGVQRVPGVISPTDVCHHLVGALTAHRVGHCPRSFEHQLVSGSCLNGGGLSLPHCLN